MSQPTIIATEDLPTAGALVYWRLEGVVYRGDIEEDWTDAGLPTRLMPKAPCGSTALRRAMRELRGSRRLVRPLTGRGHFALVNESIDRSNGVEALEHSTSLTVKLRGEEQLEFAPTYHPDTQAVTNAFVKHVAASSQSEVGSALVKLVAHLDGLSLRDTGGFYYLPPSKVAAWEAAMAIFAKHSKHKLFKIPAMRSEDAMTAIIDALQQEADAEVKDMESVLAEEDAGVVKLRNRHSHCESVEEKVTRYEELLGTKLDDLRARLESLRANLAAAVLKAQADSDVDAAA